MLKAITLDKRLSGYVKLIHVNNVFAAYQAPLNFLLYEGKC